MPLEPEEQRHVTAAQGYVELGMFLDADTELNKVDADVRHLPEVLAVRIEVYGALKKWELMQTVAKKLAQYDPDDPQWAVSWAYATRRADSIEAARVILVNAVEQFPKAAGHSLQSRLLRMPAWPCPYPLRNGFSGTFET
jgi:thioredoxin-like negative regulator of GroEL